MTGFASACALSLCVAFPAFAEDDTETILQRFASDYADDPMAQSEVFGIEVGDGRWHVAAQVSDEGIRDVVLRAGFPETPTFYFKTNAETLSMIDRGELSPLTAMGAESSDQLTPLDVLFMEGFEKSADYDERVRPLIFHFWTRGAPEIVTFAADKTRIVHGAPVVALYYYDDFRSAWYLIPPGIGEDQAPTIAVPFPRLLIVTDGTMNGHVDGNPFTLTKGQTVFVPPNVPAKGWNGGDANVEFIFLMFGEGA